MRAGTADKRENLCVLNFQMNFGCSYSDGDEPSHSRLTRRTLHVIYANRAQLGDVVGGRNSLTK